jgi:hypothetical protein
MAAPRTDHAGRARVTLRHAGSALRAATRANRAADRAWGLAVRGRGVVWRPVRSRVARGGSCSCRSASPRSPPQRVPRAPQRRRAPAVDTGGATRAGGHAVLAYRPLPVVAGRARTAALAPRRSVFRVADSGRSVRAFRALVGSRTRRSGPMAGPISARVRVHGSVGESCAQNADSGTSRFALVLSGPSSTTL